MKKLLILGVMVLSLLVFLGCQPRTDVLEDIGDGEETETDSGALAGQAVACTTCSEADGGKNIFVSSSATGKKSTTSSLCVTGTDLCVDKVTRTPKENSNAVKENFCEAAVKKSEIVDCPAGSTCKEGACKFPCGNGLIEGIETCDDGNAVTGDGCSAVRGVCTIEPGAICTGSPSVCTRSSCGNGAVESGEACDDGNPVAGLDGCSASCVIDAGWNCTGSPSVCYLCGNGKMEGPEVCDDGNTNPLQWNNPPVLPAEDTCTSDCKGYDADPGSNYGVQGICKDTTGSFTDNCMNSSNLREYDQPAAAVGTLCSLNEYKCYIVSPGKPVCLNGACVAR